MTNISSGATGYYVDIATKSASGAKEKNVLAQSAPKLSDDAYMPGTEGKLLDVYTNYIPTSGGRMDFKSGTIQQGYIALTLVAGEGKGAPSSGLITESEIDKNKPGAVFSSGKWVNVTDFLSNQNRSADNTSPSDSSEQNAAPKESYTWQLSREDSAKIFGEDRRLYVSEMTSDDSTFNPFADCGKIDPLDLRFVPPTPTGVRSVIGGAANSSTLTAESQSNLKKQMDELLVIHRFEQENNYDFSVKPHTPEGKKEYNEMAIKLRQEPELQECCMLPPLLGSLNQIEGSDWKIADGAEALIGHSVLYLYETDKATSDSFANEYGAVNPRINEYGFAVDLPGMYKDLSYLINTLQPPNGQPTKAVVLGLDAGQTYSPEINYSDALLGLAGMSLEDRKTFLTTAQKILDEVAPGLDVRQLKFTTGYLNEKDMKNGVLSLMLDVTDGPIAEMRETIEQALNANRMLFEMKEKADYASNKGPGELTISVLDASGNALAKDQVRLIAGGQSIITTVDTIKDMDQKQLLDYVSRA